MITSDNFFYAVHKMGFELLVVSDAIMQNDHGEAEQNKPVNHIHITLRNTQLNRNVYTSVQECCDQ